MNNESDCSVLGTVYETRYGVARRIVTCSRNRALHDGVIDVVGYVHPFEASVCRAMRRAEP